MKTIDISLSPVQNKTIWCLQNGYVLITDSEITGADVAHDNGNSFHINNGVFYRLVHLGLIYQSGSENHFNYLLTPKGKTIKTKPVKEFLTPAQPKTGIKYRIYLESDILHDDELISARRKVFLMLKKNKEPFLNDIFDEALDYAWHDLPKTWAAIKRADEIYANSSLMPLSGNTYMGAPVIFNEMMKMALKENITGKTLIFLVSNENMKWDKRMIDLELMPKVFGKGKNNIFCVEYDDEYKLVPVDVKQVLKNHK